MNWEAIGAIGEIAGAIAVFCSLAYLAMQIRAQSQESRAATMHEISAGFRDNIGSFSEGELAGIFIRANTDINSLTETEKFRLITGAQRVLRLWEEAYHMHRRGRLEANIWNSMNKHYASIFGAPAMQFVWKMRGEFYDEEFQKFVDAVEPLEYRL